MSCYAIDRVSLTAVSRVVGPLFALAVWDAACPRLASPVRWVKEAGGFETRGYVALLGLRRTPE